MWGFFLLIIFASYLPVKVSAGEHRHPRVITVNSKTMAELAKHEIFG